jgi:hypothetical protein
MKRLSLGLGALALAVACSQSAKAETFTFSFSPVFGFDTFSGSGTFTATEEGHTDVYDITGITGMVDGMAITGLLNVGTFDGNDNKLIEPAFFGLYNFDQGGVSFKLQDGSNVNLGAAGLVEVADLDKPGKGDDRTEIVSTYVGEGSPTQSPVPEPGTLALLGTGMLGAAGAIRRRLTV